MGRSDKYQPTRDDVLTVLKDNRQRGAMTLPDVRRAVQDARGLPTTYAPSERWSGDVTVNPISDTALKRVLGALTDDGTIMAFGVGDDPVVPTPYGTNPNSTMYLAAEDYRARRAAWEEAQAQAERQRTQDKARKKAQDVVLARYADEVNRLTADFLADKEN